MEFAFVFYFPWVMFFLAIGLSFVIAWAGSYFAILEYRDKPIATIVKGLY